MVNETKTLSERCRHIELLLLDVDGVLTDGSITYTDHGQEIKSFHVRDGTGIKMWLHCGKRAGLLTGRTSRIVERRGAELGLDPVIQGADNKLVAMEKLLKKAGLTLEKVAYVGDDLIDVPTLRAVGLGIAVADACAEAQAAAGYVTTTRGGRGAVREVVEMLLKSQERWHDATQLYLA